MILTYEQAVSLRKHQLQGFYVDPEALQEAIGIIQRTRPPRKKPQKCCAKAIRPDDPDALAEVVADAHAVASVAGIGSAA